MSDRNHLFFDILDLYETVMIIDARVAGITGAGYFLQDNLKDIFIPRSLIVECDRKFETIQLGMKITIKIARWVALKKGLVE